MQNEDTGFQNFLKAVVVMILLVIAACLLVGWLPSFLARLMGSD